LPYFRYGGAAGSITAMTTAGSASAADRAAVLLLVDHYTPLLVRLVTHAGVLEAYGHRARSVAEVAAEAGVHAPTLARVLRALESRGVVESVPDGRHRLTAAGRLLLAGEPGSMRGLANFKPWEIHPWAESLHTLRTGEPAFPAYYGKPYFDWLAERPELAADFNASMRRRTASLLAAGIDAYDWPDTGTLVDIGGGNGQLLAAVLATRPGLRGMLVDLPQGVAEAPELLAAAGVADRVEIRPGDFFGALPPGGSHYVLSSVLHDWADEPSVRILRRCREAMTPDARLVLFESVLRPGAEPDPGKQLDLHMLVLVGGRERARDEWAALLAAAGFTLDRVVPTAGLAWIEASPAR
jgi:hypothetical protein